MLRFTPCGWIYGGRPAGCTPPSPAPSVIRDEAFDAELPLLVLNLTKNLGIDAMMFYISYASKEIGSLGSRCVLRLAGFRVCLPASLFITLLVYQFIMD